MNKPLVSILLNTLERYDLTVKCIGGALANRGYEEIEFLCSDNGSSDRRVIDYIKSLSTEFFAQYPENKGCAKAHNQMMLRARGDYICLLDNDIELPPDWLAALVHAAEVIPQTGVAGIYTESLSPEQHGKAVINGVEVHPALPPKEDAVFGTRLFSKRVIEKVGYFCEDYGPYGLVDNEYNTRVHHSGFINYHIGGMTAKHLGVDVGENTPYRRMKDESMRIASPIMGENIKRYFATGNFYVGPPEEW